MHTIYKKVMLDILEEVLDSIPEVTDDRLFNQIYESYKKIIGAIVGHNAKHEIKELKTHVLYEMYLKKVLNRMEGISKLISE